MKATDRSKDTQGKGSKQDVVNDAKDSARVKVVESTEKIQLGMKCSDCGRLCYKTWDNRCAVYTPDFIHDHATLLVSCRSFSAARSAYIFSRLEENLVSFRTRFRML